MGQWLRLATSPPATRRIRSSNKPSLRASWRTTCAGFRANETALASLQKLTPAEPGRITHEAGCNVSLIPVNARRPRPGARGIWAGADDFPARDSPGVSGCAAGRAACEPSLGACQPPLGACQSTLGPVSAGAWVRASCPLERVNRALERVSRGLEAAFEAKSGQNPLKTRFRRGERHAACCHCSSYP